MHTALSIVVGLMLAASSALAQAPGPSPAEPSGWLANWWWIILIVVVIAAGWWYWKQRA